MKTFASIIPVKKLISIFLICFAMLFAPLICCNLLVESYSEEFVFEQYDDLPQNRVGLVLGTSKYLRSGGINPYFHYRMKAAANLYHLGKVKSLLLSGDNGTIYYNEPIEMKKELVKLGVPAKDIYLDFAGFRTLDSVIRCNKVFGQSKFTIISQGFQNKRAVYISRKAGIDAVGFNAQDLTLSGGLKVQTRELFARVKLFIDLYVTEKEPKFLGEKIVIN